jgi:hypothetical protein
VTGRNTIGVRENINLNRVPLSNPFWEILATLLHEMCHSWQYYYGKPSKSWFHNKEFQLKMLEFGIVINNKGTHVKVGDPFMFILKKHGVSLDGRAIDGIITIPPKAKPKGKSKLKKWTCGCKNIRVAVADFQAKCLKCGNQFELVE